jgi:hypothetical protein
MPWGRTREASKVHKLDWSLGVFTCSSYMMTVSLEFGCPLMTSSHNLVVWFCFPPSLEHRCSVWYDVVWSVPKVCNFTSPKCNYSSPAQFSASPYRGSPNICSLLHQSKMLSCCVTGRWAVCLWGMNDFLMIRAAVSCVLCPMSCVMWLSCVSHTPTLPTMHVGG